MINYNQEDLHDHHAMGAFIKKGNRYVMLKHNKFGFWTIPVGKVKPDQTIEEGLREEMREEVGIELDEFKEIAMCPKVYKRNGRNVNVIIHVFLVTKYTGLVVNNEPHKHSAMTWMTSDEIRKMSKFTEFSDSTMIGLEAL